MKAVEEEFYKALGYKLFLERSRLGITQERLGEILGLSRVSIVNIEKGKQKPSIYQLCLIAEKFNLTLDMLTSAYMPKPLSNKDVIQGRDVDKKAIIEFNNFLSKINK